MKRIICFIKAVIDFIKYGVFIQHVYEDTEESAIIIATEHGFRISNSLQHKRGEIVYPNATLIRSKCIYCGHEDLGWKDNEHVIPTLK